MDSLVGWSTGDQRRAIAILDTRPMVLTPQPSETVGITDKFLRWINLRDGEGNRTLLMFAFYTTTSSGLVWLEACAIDLFLAQYGAVNLPLIYIASSGIKIGLSLLHSGLQRFLPLRWVIVLIALLMALPLPFFWSALRSPAGLQFGGFYVVRSTVLLMQLWLEASHALNELNASITANQLFNIREVKRTYPLISSGILVADVVSGFSLPILLAVLPRGQGLRTVIFLSFVLMLSGAVILFCLSWAYRQSFPEAPRRRRDDKASEASMPRIRGEIGQYVTTLQIFFGLAQVFLLLVEFQFLGQLGQQPNLSDPNDRGDIASFLGVFNGSLGVCELIMQWAFSSRIIDRIGAFASVRTLPIVIIVFGGLAMSGMVPIFLAVVGLRFVYELLHYTLFSGVGPFLFYSLPEQLRNREQAKVRGIAEPIATAITGLALFGLIGSGVDQIGTTGRNFIFGMMLLLATGWLLTSLVLKRQYLQLLVLKAERGQLSGSEVDLRALRQAVTEKLEKAGPEAEKRSCIELLSQIDPKGTGDVVASVLLKLTPTLQQKSLEEMLKYPNVAHLEVVKALSAEEPSPEVKAMTLRYIWLTDSAPNLEELRKQLSEKTHPIIRGTAAALVLRQGSPTEKAIATNTLRLMLTHKQEQEREMGCRALGEAVYLQALRVYVPELLKDPAIEVRKAVLEAIGATRLEEHYPKLLRGLKYKATREAAKNALVRLDNEALPMLTQIADSRLLPDLVRSEALSAIGLIGTPEAIDTLIDRLQSSWGNIRYSLLKILLKIPQERGIESVLDRLGRKGIEELIAQELTFIGQIYAAQVDLTPTRVRGQEADLLRRALEKLPADGIDRLFLLMRFLYPLTAIQAAAFNIQSGSKSNKAEGLEILDNTLDISTKRAFLALIDHDRVSDKLKSLSDLVPYVPMRPHDRLKYLLDLRHFISDWSLACCFHLAARARWKIAGDHIEACLNHSRGFVREAALSYVEAAAPQALERVLPKFENDQDPLVTAQVTQMMNRLGIAKPPVNATTREAQNNDRKVVPIRRDRATPD